MSEADSRYTLGSLSVVLVNKMESLEASVLTNSL